MSIDTPIPGCTASASKKHMPLCCTAYVTDTIQGDIYTKVHFRCQHVTLCLVTGTAEPEPVAPFEVMPIQKYVLLCCRGDVSDTLTRSISDASTRLCICVFVL